MPETNADNKKSKVRFSVIVEKELSDEESTTSKVEETVVAQTDFSANVLSANLIQQLTEIEENEIEFDETEMGILSADNAETNEHITAAKANTETSPPAPVSKRRVKKKIKAVPDTRKRSAQLADSINDMYVEGGNKSDELERGCIE